MIFANLPAGSALSVSMSGEAAIWSITDHLIALVADILNDANWQRGGATGTRPDRIKRPGSDRDSSKFGSDPIPVSAFNDWWDGV